MFPFFSIPFTEIRVYTFWLGLTISFICFIYMLKKMSKKVGVNENFFVGNILLFVISTFVFSRIVFILAEWRDYKYLVQDRLLNLLIMTDYNLSFVGGVLGFGIILFIKLRQYQQPHERYLDTVVSSFLFAWVIGYIAAFLWGQIYGRPTSLPIGIVYQGDDANIPYTSAVVPLAPLYAIASFIMFSVLYIVKELFKIPGLIGYLWIWLFSIVLLLGEFFSGTEDVMRSWIWLNITQVAAILWILLSGKWIWKQIRTAR